MPQALIGVETPPTFLPYHFEVECSGPVYTSNKCTHNNSCRPYPTWILLDSQAASHHPYIHRCTLQ